MPTYTVELDGKQYDIEGDRPPTEEEAREAIGSYSPQKTALENRPSAMADLIKNPTTMEHPVGSALRTLGGAAELYQGVPASIALDLQAGKPEDIMGNLGKVVTGQRPAEYGDVFRGAIL